MIDHSGHDHLKRPPHWAFLLTSLLTVPIVGVVVATVDTTSLGAVWQEVTSRPLGLLVALVAFGGAFTLRTFAWRSVLPDLSLGHAWAGLHVALGGNHLLPLRLGEPLRIVSVVRRAGIDWQRATASTITLRAADIVSIAAIGIGAGIGTLSAWWAVSAIVGVGVALVSAGYVWLRRLRETNEVRLPGAVALGATASAWALEAVVVYQVGGWAGVDLTFAGAMMVTAAAVVAQIAAFAPGGVGTYEAGGVAAMVFLGIDPPVGLAVVVSAHAVKTVYSLVLGGVALFVPKPGMWGRFRIEPARVRSGRLRDRSRGGRPVVLFMPAFNEAASVASVVERVPEVVEGHPVLCLVVDDGSTDGTAEVARRAGAIVLSQEKNRGLGAAVRTGLRRALDYDPVAVAFCDADGEYAPEELGILVRPILDGAGDYVVGSRFAGDIERMHPHRRVGNVVLTWLLAWVSRHRISDGQSGYRAFSPRAAESAEVIHDFNYAQVLTLDLLAKGMRYVEVPISYRFRTTGQSFIKLGRYLRAVVPAVYREINTA